MDPGEQTTGTRDEHFNLVSVLYHALQGADSIEVYIFDAETSGNERLAAFFRETQAIHVQIAERAKELLGIPEAPPTGGLGRTPSRVASRRRRPRRTTSRGASRPGTSRAACRPRLKTPRPATSRPTHPPMGRRAPVKHPAADVCDYTGPGRLL